MSEVPLIRLHVVVYTSKLRLLDNNEHFTNKLDKMSLLVSIEC